MNLKKQKPVHPGEIILKEFLEPLKMTKYRLAKSLNIPAQRLGDIVNKKRSITTDTALRLACFFKTTPDFWLGIQMEYDLQCASATLQKMIKKEVKPCDLLDFDEAA